MNDFFVVENPPETAMAWTLGLFMVLALYLWVRKETGGDANKKDAMAVAGILGLLAVPLVMGAIVALTITGLIALYTLLFSLFK